jgi:hypothetical protein
VKKSEKKLKCCFSDLALWHIETSIIALKIG